MTIHYQDDQVTLLLGKCEDLLTTLPDASVDAIVCDPPYELGFMGKAWDASGIAYNVDMWRQCWRVLKPGGHLLAFGATRTYHRMTVAIEDAGFEIRDSLHWIYGSGFPKGQDIAKGIDKRKRRDYVLAAVDLGLEIPGNNLHDWTKAEHSPGDAWWEKFKAHLAPDDWQRIERRVIGVRETGIGTGRGDVAYISDSGNRAITASATPEAKCWQGWSTTLKPAHEPIVMARKSTGLNTTVANVLEHGTGALNIDACRTAAGQDYRDKHASVVGIASPRNMDAYGDLGRGSREDSAHDAGRWPTNILLGHSPDCAEQCSPGCPVIELGSEARFFPAFRYEAKAPASERPRLADGTAHTTVKPLALMRWLIRLVTPPGGTVLDHFAGSGTTLEAAVIEGFPVIGIEESEPHAQLCVTRLAKPIAPLLFGEVS
ncbi:DNA-methyltransferase [Streptomyces sp. NPDC056437]|uniref:DNA-methyltransferase n=1 Tax=Streptomyces sp. NPDC056437 TaxID=3345816 RepID=UPI0036941072